MNKYLIDAHQKAYEEQCKLWRTTTDLERVALDALDELGKELGNDIVPGSMLEAKLYHLEQAIRTLFRAPEQNIAAQVASDPAQSGTDRGQLEPDTGEIRAAAPSNVKSSQPASAIPEESIAEVRRVAKLVAWTQPKWSGHLMAVCDSAARSQAELAELRDCYKLLHYAERQAIKLTVEQIRNVIDEVIKEGKK